MALHLEDIHALRFTCDRRLGLGLGGNSGARFRATQKPHRHSKNYQTIDNKINPNLRDFSSYESRIRKE